MKKLLIENCQRLHIRDVGFTIPKGAVGAVLDIGKEEIKVIGRLTNLRNGYRYFFLCPVCLKPYESLFMADFGGWLCRLLFRCCVRFDEGSFKTQFAKSTYAA